MWYLMPIKCSVAFFYLGSGTNHFFRKFGIAVKSFTLKSELELSFNVGIRWSNATVVIALLNSNCHNHASRKFWWHFHTFLIWRRRQLIQVFRRCHCFAKPTMIGFGLLRLSDMIPSSACKVSWLTDLDPQHGKYILFYTKTQVNRT